MDNQSLQQDECRCLFDYGLIQKDILIEPYILIAIYRVSHVLYKLGYRADKQRHFDALTALANRISAEKHRAYEGQTLRVLIDGETGKDAYNLAARTDGGRLVHLKGAPSLVGSFADVRITASNTWALYGELRACAAGGGESKPGISAAAPLAGRGD